VDEFPVQVVARAPGQTMTAVFSGRPWRLPDLVRRLADAAADLHALPVPAWARGSDWSLAERRLALPRHLVGLLPLPELATALDAVARLLPRLEEGPAGICHGDFHPFNVLVHGRQLAVIDWTDSGIGDPHGDVARTLLLFRLVGTAAPSAAQRSVLGGIGPWLARRYLATYRRRRPLDSQRLRLWEPVHLLQLWAQALGDEREVFGPSVAGVRYRNGLASILRARLQRALAAT
jgi:aminoglycoside phosphotransferase (APT) family kinase protein